MGSTIDAAQPAWKLKRYAYPGTVVARITARRTTRSAIFVALLFGMAVASKALGYASAYKTLPERAQLAATFHDNIGLNILLGVPHGIDTVAGFTSWNALGIFAIIGGIWGLLMATKNFRGEEDSGRLESLLTGQTTARLTALNTLLGMAMGLAVAFIIMTTVFLSVGRVATVDYSIQSALYFGLAAIAGAAEFMAVGALTSQLMPTKALATRLAAAMFGVSFLLRAVADTTGAHWLLNFTPLGWIEKAQPLYQSQPIWLLPIGGMIALFSGLAIWLAGRRDLGASIIPVKDSAKPHTRLLNNSFLASLRLTRGFNLGWVLALTFVSTLFGLVAPSAAKALEQSPSASQTLGNLSGAGHINGTATFLGVVFFMLMNLMMLYAASSLGAAREDESQGYLDNFLVRRVSRLRWLAGRFIIILGTLALIAGIVSLTVWFAESSQDAGVSYHTILLAALNGFSPVFLVLGIAGFALGVWPRQTTLIGYGIIAWSFMLQLLSSGIKLNHWLLDTAVLHHVSLAPAVSPDWRTDAIMVGLGCVLAVSGSIAFNRRDLQTE